MNWNIRRLVIICVLAISTIFPALAQNPELQDTLPAVNQAAAENKEKIRQYQWMETTQLTLKGDAKPPTKNSCVYGPDGKVQKTMIGAPPPNVDAPRLCRQRGDCRFRASGGSVPCTAFTIGTGTNKIRRDRKN